MNKKVVLAGFTFIMSLLWISIAYSQEINLSASVDKNVVSLGDVVTLTVTVSGNVANVPKPVLPPLKNFDIYSQGTSRNISFINGRVSSSISYTYSLLPKTTGTFTIASCTLKVKGKTFTTQPIEIEVTKGVPGKSKRTTKGKSNVQIFNFPFEEKPRKQIKRGNDVFIKTSVNKRTAYKGEEIILTFKLYSNVSFLSQPEYIPPETKNFWKEAMGKEKRSTEILNGKQYETIELKYALFPLTTGKLTIGRATLNCVIDNFMSDPFSFDFSPGVKKHLVSEPITINVLPLPSPPPNFSGAVGNFHIEAHLNQNSTKQNEPITLITTIRGNGNLRNVEMPEVSIPGFKIYDSGAQVKTGVTGNLLTETKIFKTILIPTRSGKFEIPELPFVYFDPKKGAYRTLTTKTLNFTVSPGKSETSTERIFTSGNVEELGRDINYIKTPSHLKNEANLFGSLKYLFLMNGLIFVAFLWVFASQQIKENMKLKKDIIRKRTALGNALKVVKQAEQKAKTGKVREGYELLHKAILQFFADKFNMSIWGTTEDDIRYHLQQMGTKQETINEVFLLIGNCNRARYSKETLKIENFNKDAAKTITLLKTIKV